MADLKNNDVEEGHVLGFLPDTEQCRKLKYEMIKADFNDRNNAKRKIFIVNITPKINENNYSFLERLEKIINENERKQKAKEEKEKKKKEEKESKMKKREKLYTF